MPLTIKIETPTGYIKKKIQQRVIERIQELNEEYTLLAIQQAYKQYSIQNLIEIINYEQTHSRDS